VLPQILPHVVKEGGCVLVMQNGLGLEQEVAGLVGPNVHVLGGMAFLCSHKVGPGHIRHMDYGDVRLGHHRPDGAPAGITPPLQSVGADFTRAGLPVELEQDLVLARWKKLVWNIPYNGLAVVLHATTDRLMSNLHTRSLCESLMREVAAGAAAFGRTIDDEFIRQMLANTDKMVAYKPSMLLDYEKHRPMEIQAIYGNPLKAAAARGVSLPRIEALCAQLRFLDAHSDNDSAAGPRDHSK
jgi:2-dehydropantoate 2-reductase